MAKKKIPDHLQPKVAEVDDPQVATDLTVARTYDPSQINSLQSLGLIKLDGQRFRDIGELGVAAKNIGLIRLIHGGCMVSIDKLLQSIGWAAQVVDGVPDPETGKIPTAKERAEAGKLIGYLSGQLAKVGQGVSKVEQNRVEAAIAVDRQRRQSFQPGMVIKVDSVPKPPVPA